MTTIVSPSPIQTSEIDVTTGTIDIGSPINGDLILVTAAAYSSAGGNLSIPVGWVEISLQIAGTTDYAIFGRIADGSEGSSVSITASGQSFLLAAEVYILRQFRGDIANDIDVSTNVFQESSASIANVEPSAVTAGWGAESTNLFFTICTVGRVASTFATKPSGYSFSEVASGVNGSNHEIRLTVGNKFANTAVEDPTEYITATFRYMGTTSLVIRSAEIDITAPIISSPTSTVIDAVSANGTVSTDEGNGTLHFYASTNATETEATIKGSGSSQAVTTVGVQAVTVTGLTPETANYRIHYVHSDSSANDSNVVSSPTFITPELQLTIDSISPATIRVGDTVTLNISNSSGAGQVLTTSAGTIPIVTESASVITFVAPDPFTFGDKTLTFEQAITITLADGAQNDTIPMTIDIPAADVVFGQVTSLDPAGVYANDPDLIVGDFVYFERLTGDVFFDVGTGLGANSVASTARYNAYRGDWTVFASVSYPSPSSAPVVISNPSSMSVRESAVDAIMFTVSASGVPVPTVQWQKDTQGNGVFADVAGETSLTLTVTGTAVTVSANNGDQYRAVFTNTEGTATTTAATLTVSESVVAPAITSQPTSQTVQEGSSNTVLFISVAFGVPAPTIQWQKDTQGSGVFADVSGATNTTLQVVGANVTQSANNGDQYRAIFTNAEGTATSTVVLLTVAASASAIPNAVVTGVVDAAGNPVTRTYDRWYITDSDINQSNFDSQVVNIVSRGTGLPVVNGAASIQAPGTSLGVSYTFVAWVVGASQNASAFYFRDVSVTIVAGA